jgi:hypothetical protein
MESADTKNISETVDGLFQAVTEQNQSTLEKLSINFGMSLMEFEKFPQPIFSSILTIVKNSKFQKMRGSYFLLGNIFKNNFEMLSNIQKGELFDVLKESYHSFEDSTTCMVAVEIMVDLFRDEQSLNALRYLKTVDADKPRAIVCYGLYYFIKEIHNNEYIARAIDELEKMKNDPSQVVQQEAREALFKLKKETTKN